MSSSHATPPAVRAQLTIDQLQALARVASNNNWTRWWAHWNHPASPTQMAISMMDETGKTLECEELCRRGFERFVNDRGFIIYVCDRVDENRRPFISRL